MSDVSDRIDDLIAATPDWRGQTLARLREIIHEADPDIIEEWKWASPNRPGVPVWEHAGIVCHINVLKDRVKLTLHQGVHLPDPHGLFNSRLEGSGPRAIDISKGDPLDEAGLKELIRAGVEFNVAKAKPARKK